MKFLTGVNEINRVEKEIDELDHYLTHLVGNIAKNTRIGNCEEGLKTIREEVNDAIEKERLNSNGK